MYLDIVILSQIEVETDVKNQKQMINAQKNLFVGIDYLLFMFYTALFCVPGNARTNVKTSFKK